MSSPLRVVGVVPVWSRGPALRALLESVEAQTRPLNGLVVVDNDATDEARAAYAPFAADIVAVPQNVGAVAGFREGIRRAWALGADAAWLLDDDSVAHPDALAALADALAEDPRLGGAAPTVAFPDGRRITGWRWGAHTARGFGHEPARGDGTFPIDWAPFAGLLLRRDACEAAGDLRRDFFLWHADVEYCLRIVAAGYGLAGVTAAVVDHPLYDMRARRVLGRRFAVRVASPWQEYEDARNWALLTRALRGTPQADRTPWWRRVVGEFARSAAVIAADPHGAARVRMRLQGLTDGWRAHPRPRVAGAPPAALTAYASAPDE